MQLELGFIRQDLPWALNGRIAELQRAGYTQAFVDRWLDEYFEYHQRMIFSALGFSEKDIPLAKRKV